MAQGAKHGPSVYTPMSIGTCELQEVDDMSYYLSSMCGQEISRGRFGVVFQHQGSCAMKVVQRAPSRLVLQAGGAVQEDTELELQTQLEHTCICPCSKSYKIARNADTSCRLQHKAT